MRGKTELKKQRVFSGQQTRGMVDQQEQVVAAAFLDAVARVDNLVTNTIAGEALDSGDPNQIIDLMVLLAALLSRSLAETYNLSLTTTYDRLVVMLGAPFPNAELGAVDAEQQRLATFFNQSNLTAMVFAVSAVAALNLPRRQAIRLLKMSVGLTRQQFAALLTYRQALTDMSLASLSPQLRDQDADERIRRAIAEGAILTDAAIFALLEAYRNNLLNFRAMRIAQTETTQTVHNGIEAVLAAAVFAGVLAADSIIRTWRTRQDSRVRPTHRPMHGQQRPANTSFTSGGGVSLRFPGDPNAPGSEIVGCRCYLQFDIA